MTRQLLFPSFQLLRTTCADIVSYLKPGIGVSFFRGFEDWVQRFPSAAGSRAARGLSGVVGAHSGQDETAEPRGLSADVGLSKQVRGFGHAITPLPLSPVPMFLAARVSESICGQPWRGRRLPKRAAGARFLPEHPRIEGMGQVHVLMALATAHPSSRLVPFRA